MNCPNCGAAVFVKGSQWECGWCGNCGRLAPVPRPAPTVRLTIRPQTQSASLTPASPKNAPAPWTSPTWQLRLKNYFAEDPSAALALWREALGAAGPQLQRSRTTAEQLLPNVIQRPWLYENDETHLLPGRGALRPPDLPERLCRQPAIRPPPRLQPLALPSPGHPPAGAPAAKPLSCIRLANAPVPI